MDYKFRYINIWVIKSDHYPSLMHYPLSIYRYPDPHYPFEFIIRIILYPFRRTTDNLRIMRITDKDSPTMHNIHICIGVLSYAY